MSYGLQRDAVTISRPAQTSDADGNYTGTLATVWSGLASYGTPSSTEALQANQRGDTLDAVMAIANGVDVRLGDVVDMRGKRWVALAVRDVRLHQRVMLRQDVA